METRDSGTEDRAKRRCIPMTQIADLRVGNLMTLDPVIIDPDATAAEAESILKTASAACLSSGPGKSLASSVSRISPLPGRAR
jgi:hypothetical protein